MTVNERAQRVNDYLAHMLEALRLVVTYTEGLSKADFVADKRTQQAVILNLITIGEAASRIFSDHQEFAAAHPGIPWQQMRGMRNRMAHGYFDINIDVVWDTVESSLPDLERQLTALRAMP